MAGPDDLNARFRQIHESYYEYEWKWAYDVIREYYGVDLSVADISVIRGLVDRWKESVVALDKLLYEDAKKEFNLSMIAGVDGITPSEFENYPFVVSVREHMDAKTSLAEKVLKILDL